MSFLFPTSPATGDAFEASWMNHPILYLAVAAVCLLIALRFLKRAVAPVGAVFQAMTAAAIVAFTAAVALMMLVIAIVAMVR